MRPFALRYAVFRGVFCGLSHRDMRPFANEVSVSADGTVKVYTIDGVYVGLGKAADMLGKLAKDIYIINGTKIVLK